MSRRSLLIPIFLMLSIAIAGQSPSPTATSEEDAKLEKAAIDLLRDTSNEVGRLRTMENRISFNAELASLMWFHDDKEAKAMYGGVVTDFKQLLSQLDAEMNSPESADEELGGPGFFGGYGKSRAERKLRVAMEVRKQIAMSLAEHAPELAFNFFYDSLTLISDPEFRKSQQDADKYFETQLIQQIAQSDAAKGVEFGKEAIKKGVDNNHIALLQKIYAKDADKGIDFGAALLSRIKSDDAAKNNVYLLGSLLQFGDKTAEDSKKANGKKAVYERSDLRDIAELIANVVVQKEDSDTYAGSQFVDLVEKYSPGRAAQIRAKIKRAASNSNSFSFGSNSAANIATMSTEEITTSAMSSNSNAASRRAIEERDARDKAEKKLMDDIKGLGGKALPKEQRDKIVEQSRKIIAQTPGKDKKLMALSMLAAQVAKAGDKELANEIMGDAERYVNPQPKNYQDFLMSWILASGYAEANPDKAFPLLESTILRANDTITAFIKVAEFIDVQDEIISDGEVQVGMFGGSMVRGVTSELGLASSTISSLAKADFQKTVNLTNTFDRTEVRVLAKMMVLRSVLDVNSKTEMDKLLNGEITPDDIGG